MAANAQDQYAVDTVFHRDSLCGNLFPPYWYAKAKYPESSRRLAQMADAVLPQSVLNDSLNGYVNLQFLVNCKGKTTAYRLSQTNMHYEPVLFPAALVNALYYFVQSLKAWKPALDEGKPVYYKSYLAFKIRQGHVVEVSP
jgi:hypothetical protein